MGDRYNIDKYGDLVFRLPGHDPIVLTQCHGASGTELRIMERSSRSGIWTRVWLTKDEVRAFMDWWEGEGDAYEN